MKTIHAKSPCCRGEFIRYGNRRRQCVKCSRTWRIRHKKRGRKKKRASKDFLKHYLDGSLPSIKSIAQRRGCTTETVRQDLRRARDLALRTVPWKWPPKESPLVAVVDALEERIQNIRYTVYLIMLKPTISSKAIICPPVILKGKEDSRGWKAAFQKIPISIQACIQAIACDGSVSIHSIAVRHNWPIQRCHFHLRLRINNYLSASPLSRHKAFAFLVHSTVTIMLNTRDQTRLARSRRHLIMLIQLSNSQGLKKVLRGFLENMEDYRTYLRYPELHLPTTTNAAESLVQCARDLFYQARGYRTPSSFMKWVKVLYLIKKDLNCRGFDQPK